MTKDQYILAVSGLLDQESADLLLRELATLLRSGYRRITLDARELGPVLPEGILELRRGMADIAEDFAAGVLPGGSPAGPRYALDTNEVEIECVALSANASAQFLLHAVPVSDRRAVLFPPVAAGPVGATVPEDVTDGIFGEQSQRPAERAQKMPVPAVAQIGASGWIVDCPACRHACRVRSPGDYGCPVCGCAFRMDADGKIFTHPQRT